MASKKKKIRFRISKVLIFLSIIFLSDIFFQFLSSIGSNQRINFTTQIKARTYFKFFEIGNSELELGPMNNFNKRKRTFFLGGTKTPV